MNDASMMTDRLPAFDRIAAPVAWWAARRPDQPALVETGTDWTYATLHQAIETACDLLVCRGVRRGDRVVVIGDNSAAMIAMMLGASLAGAWVVPLNPRLTDREIDAVVEHATPRCLAAITAASPRARTHAARLGATPQTLPLIGSVAITATDPDTMTEPETPDVAAVIYTSGTTGQPKGVMLTHHNLTYSARSSGLIRALGPDDLVYSVLPVTHSLGFTGVMLATFTYGGTVSLTPRFDPAAALRAISEGHVTVMIGAPSMFAMLVEYATRQGLTGLPQSRLRLIASAGASLDPAIKQTIETWFGQTLNNGYGITECAPTISQTRIDRPRTDCAVGMLLPGIEARLHDTLHIRGPNVMAGYYRDPAATSAVLDPDGWFDTGDLATFEDDHLFIVGRSKEQITRFGFKIYPAEVEAVLNTHPSVRQSAVIGRGNGAHQDVIAFVEPAPNQTPSAADLTEYAATHLADYKRPTEIYLITTLPLGPTGKILKSALAAMRMG